MKILLFHIHISQCSEENPMLNPPHAQVTYLRRVYEPPSCTRDFMINEIITYCEVPVG